MLGHSLASKRTCESSGRARSEMLRLAGAPRDLVIQVPSEQVSAPQLLPFYSRKKIFTSFSKKVLAFLPIPMYNIKCCGMIAVKREVACLEKSGQGFPWSECQVFKTDDKSLYRKRLPERQKQRVRVTSRARVANGSGHTRESVQSPLVVLSYKSAKRRRLFLWQVK